MSNELEIHLTLVPIIRKDFCYSNNLKENLKIFQDKEGYKYTFIKLSNGNWPDQPMLTRRAKGNLLHEFAKIEHHKDFLLESCGYLVSRVKIEVPPWSELVPIFKTDDTYYEAHIKVKIHQKDEGLLALAAQEINGHLSKNAFKKLDGDYNERFINQDKY